MDRIKINLKNNITKYSETILEKIMLKNIYLLIIIFII